MAQHPSHLLALARRGAEVRLREIAQEAKHLLEIFPHLRDSFDPDELPVGYIIAEGARQGAVTRTRRRRTMSVAARRAASERMKNYWKAHRKGEQK